MIVTKGYIYKAPDFGYNTFKVRVPLMEDNAGGIALFDAVASNPSDVYNVYSKDDPVILTFEDDQYNKAIILGKLYVDVPTDSKSYAIFNELTVTGKANLPDDTLIGGYGAKDIENLYHAVGEKGGGALDYILIRQWDNEHEEGI